MKRRLLLLLAIVVSGALPFSAWADVSLVKTADGTEFKFGMSQKIQTFTLNNLDLIGGNFDFTSFISSDTALGQQDWGIQSFSNLLFTLERGPLRIHANLEVEANMDARAVDVNLINLERMAIYYKFPTIGTLAVGFDVHAFDPEGGLIYTDEHPGVWLVGGDDDVSWDAAWHLVTNCNSGGTLFSGGSTLCNNSAFSNPSRTTTDFSQQSHLFMGRVNIGVGDGTVVSPMGVYYRRHQPQSQLNEYSTPSGGAATAPTVSNVNLQTGSYSDQFRPGAAVKSDLGAVNLTGQVVGLLGQIKSLNCGASGSPGYLGCDPVTAGTEQDFQLRSWALYLEAALDGSEIGLPPGLTPYVSVEFQSGDGNPFDKTYSGYTNVSNLSQALRKDGFKGQSIASYGPSPLGAGSSDGWGFDVMSRGTGPTLGGILPDETGGSDVTSFNNRGGKGGNPGFFKIAGGVTGKIDKNWDTHVGFNVLWYAKTDPIQAEAAQNCVAQAQAGGGPNPFGCAAGAGVSDPATVRAAQAVLQTNGVDLDQKYMGFEFNANAGYTFGGGLRLQPYLSVFFPGSIVENISDAYLSTATSGPGRIRSKVTAFTMGLEFSAAF